MLERVGDSSKKTPKQGWQFQCAALPTPAGGAMTAIASLRVDGSQSREVGAQPALSALRSAPWFSGWPSSALASLSMTSNLRSFGTGQAVAAEGKGLQAVVLVIKGRIRAVRRAEGGREVTLESFRAGELAADALFDPESVLPNDWIAAETSLLLFIPREDFLDRKSTRLNSSH